jgi:hypothetical protein
LRDIIDQKEDVAEDALVPEKNKVVYDLSAGDDATLNQNHQKCYTSNF